MISDKRRILVVDDEDAILFAYQRLFQGAAVDVDVCGTLDQAVDMIARTDYDVVLADLRLSHSEAREGLDLLENIRRQKPNTPVVLMTGYGSGDLRERMLALGVVECLVKPVQVSQLMELLVAMGLPVGKS